MALTPSKPTAGAGNGATDKKAQQQLATEDVLLREVDDAVRQDQYANFAKSYGKPLIAAVVLGLAGFGGYLYWESHRDAAREKQSETLIAALDQIEAGNLAAGSATLNPLLLEGDSGHKAAATMLKAGIALEQGRFADAQEHFAQIAADQTAPQALRDLAIIRGVSTAYDSLKPQDVVARLKPLAIPGKPFFGNAGELVAMAYLEQGKRAEAGALFAAIAKDEKAPDSLRSRSRQMAGLLGVDAIEDVDKMLKENGEAEGAPAPATQ